MRSRHDASTSNPAPAQPQTPRPGPPQTAAAPLPTLEQSFELLKEFKLGTDSTVLIPIERAVMEVHGNETARAALEKRLVAYLASTYPYVTRSFVLPPTGPHRIRGVCARGDAPHP